MSRVEPDRRRGLILHPGEYGQDYDKKWWGWPPSGAVSPAFLRNVVENADGTISTTVDQTFFGIAGKRWKGKLVAGEWQGK